jgi:hypothetical protein
MSAMRKRLSPECKLLFSCYGAVAVLFISRNGFDVRQIEKWRKHLLDFYSPRPRLSQQGFELMGTFLLPWQEHVIFYFVGIN